MAIRRPRGYTVNRPPFVEICEGARPNVQALVLEAWTGLPPVRIDEHHHDPIVLDAGTLVGVASGSFGSTSIEGKLMPSVWFTGGGATKKSRWQLRYNSTDDNDWSLGAGVITSDLDIGNVKPIGVVFQPVYSFYLPEVFTNYKRTESVGIVTDYVIQIPWKTTKEHAIRAGDLVCTATVNNMCQYGRDADVTLPTGDLAGRYMRVQEIVDGTLTGLTATTANIVSDGPNNYDLASVSDFTVGRCLKSFEYATTTSSDGTTFQDDSNTTVTSAAKNEFVGLDKVQTVPGMSLAGSGTGGIPGHLLGGASSGSSYRALTILVRL